jgi:competence protein ComEC
MSSPAPDPPEPPKPVEPAWKEFARSPLVPVALAATVGLLLDRYVGVPLDASVTAAVVCLAGWGIARYREAESAPVWLWLAAGALAAAHHRDRHHSFDPDDIGTFAPDQPAPAVLRGTLDEEPTSYRPPKPDPLLTMPKLGTSVAVLNVSAIQIGSQWKQATGKVRLTVEGGLDGLHLGDVIEAAGRLSKPGPPSNPGEMDYQRYLIDRRITAELRVRRSAAGIVRLEEGWRASLFGWLAVVRGWGTRTLQGALPHPESGIAAALLLGDNAAMDRDEWDVFVRTGVVHVLAISGQHLVVLGWFVWLVLRACGVRRRNGAWVVMAVMVVYTLLTGARPSAVRAAVMVCAFCGGIVLRRRVIPANSFALAWLVVVAINPSDPFTAGCQLSFLSVFVLIWFAAPLLAPRPLTPLELLIEESRSPAVRFLRALARAVVVAYLISLILGVVNAPLILYWQNLVSPAGVVLGPPLVLLSSVALIAGFLLLIVSPVGVWLGTPFAAVTRWNLTGCEQLARAAAEVPAGCVYAPAPAVWWLVGFYLGVALAVLLAGRGGRRALAAVAAWVILGLAVTIDVPPADEARFTFLAVGHGGCVVIETPDGRTLLYDAGTTAGPDVVRRVIAPYLWHRNVRRIDEVFLSHADLDHFNGLPELLKKFPVGQVTHTPSFPAKATPGVAATLAALDKHGVRRRVAKAGDRLEAGAVTFDVLHPTAVGPEGNENARSLVLLVRHAGHTVLLTGDLEGTGQDVVASRPVRPVDVMLAPHHGAVGANYPIRGPNGSTSPGLMAAWARPRLVVSSQRPGKIDHLAGSYGAAGGQVWDTAAAGAVTVRSHPTGLVAEAFRTREVNVIRRGGEK